MRRIKPAFHVEQVHLKIQEREDEQFNYGHSFEGVHFLYGAVSHQAIWSPRKLFQLPQNNFAKYFIRLYMKTDKYEEENLITECIYLTLLKLLITSYFNILKLLITSFKNSNNIMAMK